MIGLTGLRMIKNYMGKTTYVNYHDRTLYQGFLFKQVHGHVDVGIVKDCQRSRMLLVHKVLLLFFGFEAQVHSHGLVSEEGLTSECVTHCRPPDGCIFHHDDLRVCYDIHPADWTLYFCLGAESALVYLGNKQIASLLHTRRHVPRGIHVRHRTESR